MPEMRIKEVRLPELHLPEMSRDEISRVVGDATRDIDLAKLDPRRIDMPEIDLTKIDIPKAVTSAAQAAGLVKAPRSRVPFVIGGLVILGLVTFAVMTSPVVRPRLEELARRIRARMDAARGEEVEFAFEETSETDTSVVGLPIEPAAYASDVTSPFDDTIAAMPETTYGSDDAVAAGTIADMGSGEDPNRV